MKALKCTWIVLSLAALCAVHTLGDEERPTFSMKVLQDEGKFTYYVNEDYVGTSRSAWHADGRFENSAVIRMGGKRIISSLNIAVDGEGYWTAITMETARGPVEITRSGAEAKLGFGDQTKILALKPGSLVMEDMSPALMSQAVKAYDHEKGGKQEFSVLFIPAMVLDGSLEFLETFVRIIDGRERTFMRYFYRMAPVYNVTFIVDEKDRVCLAEYRAQHGLFIREGYDALNVRDTSDALLSRAECGVVEELNAAVPMRDGLELATDIYRPEREGKSPAILVRTPYKKEMSALQGRFYARRGYVFAIQDVRGRFASPGKWVPFVHEGNDGYDAVEWLAAQPWCDGRVGMIGASYLGWTQWWAASRKPPHLTCMIPNVAPPEPCFNFPYECGAFMLGTALWWSNIVESRATADLSGMTMMESFEIFDSDRIDKMKHLPVIELDEILFGRRIPYYREWIAHPDCDDYWKRVFFLEAMKDFDIPVYHQTGWFDGDGIGSKLNYLGMTSHGHRHQKLVIGPWGHTADDSRLDPRGKDHGPKAIVDLQKSYLRWMDRWLKGIDNGIDREPWVSLFVMGSNDWLHGNAYPLEETKVTRFYLASKGDARGGKGKGKLSTEAPQGEYAAPDRYTYDPGDPTGADPAGRDDLLIFRTEPMEAPLTIAGPLTAVLYASSSAKDTDWVLRLARIDRSGSALPLGTGVIRARYRDSLSKPELLKPGKIYKYQIDLWHTGITVDEGEHLALVVASAYFPRFSRNLNTGGHNEAETEHVEAEQTVYHDASHPSHLLLPVIPAPEFGKR